MHRSHALPGTPRSDVHGSIEEHEYVAGFLQRHEPFDMLGMDALERIAARAAIVEYAPGTAILRAGEAPQLFVIVSGTVAIEGAPSESGGDLGLAPGDFFPVAALLAERQVASNYVAKEPTCCLVFPAEEFVRLEREHPKFRAHCAQKVAGLFEQSLRVFQAQRGPGIEHLVEGPLSGVAGRAPVSCAPDTPIRDVLENMARERIGSMVVVNEAAHPIGIFTFRDMLDKVALAQPDLAQPIASVMSTELFVLPASAPVLDAVLLMAREGIRHVPLVEGGRLVGLVSESRLFTVTRGGIRETRAAIRSARTIDEVHHAIGEMRGLVERLLRQGMSPDTITRLVTTFNDVVIQRLVALLDTGGDFPAERACWIVLGSEGRGEQTLATDQDNGIVIDDAAAAADPGLRERLVALAGKVNRALDECGYPLCRGNVMASNPEWTAPLAEWQARFADWVDRGHPQSLLNAAIFFDFRAVHGNPATVERLRTWLSDYARDHGRFLLQMTNNALENQPPLGLVRDFVLASGGAHPDTLDLKVNGVQPFVESARIYALSSGVPATNTVERLRAAAVARRIPEAEVEGWIEAFRFIQGLRLKLNLEQSAAGKPLHNHLDPDTLNDLERRILKESFRQARKLQTRLSRDFGAGASGFGA